LTGVYAGFGLLLLGWIHLPRTTPFLGGIFAEIIGQIGFFSYSIYLWHIDLAQTPLKKLLAHVPLSAFPPGVVWLLATSTYVTLAVITGALLSRWFEIPALALRDRLFERAVPAVNLSELPPTLEAKPEPSLVPMATVK
jgi:peptidoglycan/LPS O-acetylase OafA/YrhL